MSGLQWIFKVILFIGCFNIVNATDNLSLREQLIVERIKPVGSLRIAGQVTETTTKDINKKLTSKDLYGKYCTLCHSSGLAGAPKFGNKDDWAPRIKKGISTLKKHAVSGFNGMPAKGTCMECSDDDITGVIKYMIKQLR